MKLDLNGEFESFGESRIEIAVEFNVEFDDFCVKFEQILMKTWD